MRQTADHIKWLLSSQQAGKRLNFNGRGMFTFADIKKPYATLERYMHGPGYRACIIIDGVCHYSVHAAIEPALCRIGGWIMFRAIT